MLRTALLLLLLLMLAAIGPVLAATPASQAGSRASADAPGAATPPVVQLAQYRDDRRSWRGEVRHHRFFGRDDGWRRHYRGSYDRPYWRDHGPRRDRWRHERWRDDHRDRRWDRDADRWRYDERHDRRGRWDRGGGHRGYERGPELGDRRFHDRRRRFEERLDRW